MVNPLLGGYGYGGYGSFGFPGHGWGQSWGNGWGNGFGYEVGVGFVIFSSALNDHVYFVPLCVFCFVFSLTLGQKCFDTFSNNFT